MYVGQMRCTCLPRPGANLWWVPLQGLNLRHPPARIPATNIHELCLSCYGVAGIPPVDPLGILYVGMYKYHGLA